MLERPASENLMGFPASMKASNNSIIEINCSLFNLQRGGKHEAPRFLISRGLCVTCMTAPSTTAGKCVGQDLYVHNKIITFNDKANWYLGIWYPTEVNAVAITAYKMWLTWECISIELSHSNVRRQLTQCQANLLQIKAKLLEKEALLSHE